MFKVSFAAAGTCTDIFRGAVAQLNKSCYLTQGRACVFEGQRSCMCVSLSFRYSLTDFCVFVRVRVHAVYFCVCTRGPCAVFTAITISLSAACVCFSVAAPQITLLFNIRKFIRKSILHFHCRKNRNDQLLERTINKVL